MAMANMNLIRVFVTQLWHVQALACGGGDGDGATKNISPKFFGDIITDLVKREGAKRGCQELIMHKREGCQELIMHKRGFIGTHLLSTVTLSYQHDQPVGMWSDTTYTQSGYCAVIDS